MPALEIEEGTPFQGAFVLKASPQSTPSAEEEEYRTALLEVVTRMERDKNKDPDGEDQNSVALRQARRSRRQLALDELRTQAAEYIAGRLSPHLAAGNAFAIRGKYLADIERLEKALFLVEPKIDSGRVTDVLIIVSETLPINNDPAAQEKRNLYVALDEASTVVKTVAQRIEDRANRFYRTENTRRRMQERSSRLRDKYMRKLVEIGRLGLQHPHVELGRLALDGFKAEFVAQEAGRIKNAYVRSLGLASLAVGVLFFGLYVILDRGGVPGFLATHKVFLLAAGGAGVGTWLSFSIRRVKLGFSDLGILEEDLLDPGLRVIFVVTLTVVVCLLFWTGALNIEIGNLKTGELRNQQSQLPIGAIAVLVGIFCGIAERSLATAISGRAAAFVKTVGA